MAETFGQLIDKLFTVDMKMWDNQELLYEIRRMTFDEFKSKYWNDEQGAEKLWSYLKKACDLNVQRNNIITEVDVKLLEIIKASSNELDTDKFVQHSHKTY